MRQFGEDHLRRILRDYSHYYHNSRPHQALERNSPTPREIEAPVKGKVISIPQVGGLHHRYRRLLLARVVFSGSHLFPLRRTHERTAIGEGDGVREPAGQQLMLFHLVVEVSVLFEVL
jgi:hypothetical protein